MCVVATNALELGVDIGHLDATIHLGYPGSVASLRQQMGRAGRSGRPSVALLIAQDSPLEQHFVARPAALIDRPLEHAAIAPRNPTLLRQHLAAAAHEQPLRLPPPATAAAAAPEAEAEPELGAWRGGSGAAQAAVARARARAAGRDAPRARRRGSRRQISLRDIDRKVVRVVVRRGRRRLRRRRRRWRRGLGGGWQEEATLETMEESAAQLRAYTSAVLLHGGASYLIDELDLSRGVAWAHREDAALPQPRDHTRVAILSRHEGDGVEEQEEEEDEDEGGGGGGAGAARLKGFVGAMRVSKSVYGYRKLAKANAKLLELVELDAPLPPHEYETRGLWIELPSRLKGDLARRGHEYARGALHAIEHLCIARAARRDVRSFRPRLPVHAARGRRAAERLLLERRGGAGVAEQLRTSLPHLLGAALPASRRGCDRGCPSCCPRVRRATRASTRAAPRSSCAGS